MHGMLFLDKRSPSISFSGPFRSSSTDFLGGQVGVVPKVASSRMGFYFYSCFFAKGQLFRVVAFIELLAATATFVGF